LRRYPVDLSACDPKQTLSAQRKTLRKQGLFLAWHKKRWPRQLGASREVPGAIRTATPRASVDIAWVKSWAFNRHRWAGRALGPVDKNERLINAFARPAFPQPNIARESRVRTVLPVFLENATGITRDVSPSSVFFWTHGGAYTAGDRISFAILICRPAGTMRLICRGDIVRTENCETMVGVAVRINESMMEFA